MVAPFDWSRGPRSAFKLDDSKGVYALFLRHKTSLEIIGPTRDGLIYVGKAGGRGGFLKRCHFGGKTTNHSPRKSLAALLMGDLRLNPILKPKPNSATTWGLDAESDQRLTEWMHRHLELAIEVNSRPDDRETELVGLHAPALNLNKCAQTDLHRMISAKRAHVLSVLIDSHVARKDAEPLARQPVRMSNQAIKQARSASLLRKTGTPLMITAVKLAAEFGLDPKHLRQALRESLKWHQKHQPWAFPQGSREHMEMLEVAKRLSLRRT